MTVLIGIPALGRPGLWADELATWGAVRLSWSRLWTLLGSTDAVNGGHYLGLKLWTGLFGTGEVALRTPSLPAMAVATAAVTAIAARTWNRRWGTTCGLVFALLPVTSRYAAEARGYALVMAAGAVASWLLLRLAGPARHRLRHPGIGWAAYTAAVVVAGVGNLISVLLLPAHAVVLAVWRWRHGRQRPVPALPWWWATGAAAVMLAPLALLGLRQIDQTGWIAPLSWHGIGLFPKALFGSRPVALLIGVGCAAAGLRRWATRRHPDPRSGDDHGTMPALCGAVLPAAVLLAMSTVVDLWFPRYLLFTVPAWVLLAMSAVAGPDPRRRRATAGSVVIAVAVAGLGAQWDIRQPDGHGHDTRGVAAVITTGYRPGDGFAVALDEPVVPWEARDLVNRYVPADRRPTDVFAVTPQRTAGRLPATECADPAACLGDTPRLWVIRFEHPTDPLTGLGAAKEALLRDLFTVTDIRPLRGLTVALLTRTAPG